MKKKHYAYFLLSVACLGAFLLYLLTDKKIVIFLSGMVYGFTFFVIWLGLIGRLKAKKAVEKLEKMLLDKQLNKN